MEVAAGHHTVDNIINLLLFIGQAKAMQNNDSKGALPSANFGPKYEQHVSEMQKQLDEANQK